VEKNVQKSAKQLKTTPDTNRVDDQTREHALQAMAKELEAKFVFVLGSANKAKRLPHMSSLQQQRENESQPEDPPPTDAACPASPSPVDVLDILQALSYKVDNLRNKLRYVEQLETPPSITTTTKIVATISQMQIDIAALF
jgi:hypothetical protein